MKPTDIFVANYMALPGLKPGVHFIGSKNPDLITMAVATFLGVEVKSLQAKSRLRHLVEARQIAMYLIKKHTNRSLKDIGSMFGGRDHTTAIHSIHTVDSLCFRNDTYKQRLLQIENLL